MCIKVESDAIFKFLKFVSLCSPKFLVRCSINISSLKCNFLSKMFVKCLWFSFPLIPRAFSANQSSMCLSVCCVKNLIHLFAPYSTPSLYSPTQVPGGKRGILLRVEGFHGGEGSRRGGGHIPLRTMFAFQFPVSCLYRISHSVCQFIEKLSESCYEFDNNLQSERYVVRMFVRQFIKRVED